MALVAGAFAVLLLATREGGRPRQLLAVFLLLISVNQGAEFARALTSSPYAEQVLFRLASLAAALDPAALAWFASSLPDARLFRRARVLVPILATGGILALDVAFVMPTGVGFWPHWMALSLYTAVTYLLLALDRVRPALEEPGWGAASLALLAYSLVLLPYVGIAGDMPYASAVREPGSFEVAALLTETTFVLAAVVAMLLIAVPYVRRPAARRRLAGALLPALALWLFLDTYHIARAYNVVTGQPDPVELHAFGRAAAPLRWLLFSAVMSIALVREDALRMSLRERRRAARALVALGALVVGVIVLAGAGADVRALDVALVALLALLSQGFRQGVDQVAWRAYGVPPPGPVARAPRASRLAPGRLIVGRYRVLDRVQGGELLARDESLHRVVELREMPAGTPEERERALREARLAGRVRSPRVAALHDIVTTDKALLLVRERVEGARLSQQIAPLGPARGREVLRDVLEGLAALHDSRVSCGLLTGEHVVLTPTGTKLVLPELREDAYAEDAEAAARVGRALVADATPEEAAVLATPWPDAAAMLAAWEEASVASR